MTQKSKCILMAVFAVLLVCIVFLFWNNRSLSGTYVGHNSNSASIFRLVETTDGKLTGQFQSIILDDDGKIVDISASVEGTTDHKNLNLLMTSLSNKPISWSNSGTRDGINITLTASFTGYLPNTSVFINSDQATYQSFSDALRKKSQNILADKAAAETFAQREQKKQTFIAQVDQLIPRLQNLNIKLESDLHKPHIHEQKYHDLTAKIQSYYDKARTIPNDGYNVQRSQIIVAMNQDVVATHQVHNDSQSSQNQFNNNVDKLLKEIVPVRNTCQAYVAQAEKIPSCDQLEKEIKTFTDEVTQVRSLINEIEQTYQAELKTQQNLIAAAERIK